MKTRTVRKRSKPATGEVVWKPRTQWVRSPRLDALGPPSAFADDADRARDVLTVPDLEEVTRRALLGDPAEDNGPLAAARWKCVAWLVLRGELSRDELARQVARRGRWSSMERERAALPQHPVEPSEEVLRFLEVRTRAVELHLGKPAPEAVVTVAGADELPAAPRVRVVADAPSAVAREVWLPAHEDALRHAAGLLEVENLTGGPLVVRAGAYGADVPIRRGELAALRWFEDSAGLWGVLGENTDGDFLDPQGYALPAHLAGAEEGRAWRR